MKTIYGIQCSVSDNRLQKTIEHVLRKIRNNWPKDFARIKRRIKIIKWLPKEDDSTLGEVISEDGDSCYYYYYDENKLCQILLSRKLIGLETRQQIAAIAHELGHAATTDTAFEKRQAPRDEWGSELTADWFAYRWGFGREIRLQNKTRDPYHHCAAPGQTFEIGIDKFIVTRNFVCRRIGDSEIGDSVRTRKHI